MDERRFDPSNLTYDPYLSDLNYDPSDPISDLTFNSSSLGAEVCLKNPVEASLSQSCPSETSFTPPDRYLSSYSTSGSPDGNFGSDNVHSTEKPVEASSSQSYPSGTSFSGSHEVHITTKPSFERDQIASINSNAQNQVLSSSDMFNDSNSRSDDNGVHSQPKGEGSNVCSNRLPSIHIASQSENELENELCSNLIPHYERDSENELRSNLSTKVLSSDSNSEQLPELVCSSNSATQNRQIPRQGGHICDTETSKGSLFKNSPATNQITSNCNERTCTENTSCNEDVNKVKCKHKQCRRLHNGHQNKKCDKLSSHNAIISDKSLTNNQDLVKGGDDQIQEEHPSSRSQPSCQSSGSPAQSKSHSCECLFGSKEDQSNKKKWEHHRSSGQSCSKQHQSSSSHCQSCGKPRLSSGRSSRRPQPPVDISYQLHEDPMLDVTFHSIPNLNYTVMGDTGSITGVPSELLTVRGVSHHDLMTGPPPLDTVSLPPEVGEGPSQDWGEDRKPKAWVCNGDVPVSRSGAIRRTISEPDINRQRRVTGFGILRPSRQGWYRRTARSHRGSLVGSLRRYQSTVAQSGWSLWKASRQDKALLLCISLTNLCAMMCMSVMAPFFPGEAEEKGVNQMLSGWIFGVFALTEFIFAPICGKMIKYVDPQFMFLAGQFFSGSCYILFGLLEYVDSSPDNNTVYLVLCFSLRVFNAIGCSAAATATFTITAATFPDNVATVFGLVETSTGLGMSLGPALGGLLYDAGGFMLPFVSLGAFMVIMVPVSKCMLPDRIQAEVCEPTSILRLLRVPAIDISCVCVCLAACVWSVLDPTLQPHLTLVEGFNLTSTLVGLIFLLLSACYGIFCPVFGFVCDHIDDTSPMLVIGFILSGLGMMLLGPSPHLGFPEGYNVLWLNLVALLVLGFSLSLAVVPTFDKILDAADKAGFEDNLEMYGVVAGLWGSCYAFGDFVGPSVGGFLAEKFSFPWCMTYIGYTCWAVALMCIVLWLYERTWGPTQVCGYRKRPIKPERKLTHDVSVENIPDETEDNQAYIDEETRPLLQPNGFTHYGD